MQESHIELNLNIKLHIFNFVTCSYLALTGGNAIFFDPHKKILQKRLVQGNGLMNKIME